MIKKHHEPLLEAYQSTYKVDGYLSNRYTAFNKKWFDGALPSAVTVGWLDMSMTDCIGFTLTLDDHDTGHIAHSIAIDRGIKDLGTIVKLTLLHEMCHVKLHPYKHHGQKFEDEMVRLAVRGAFRGLW